MKNINEPSYYLDVLIDILSDDICLLTRYRFETLEMANQFITYIKSLTHIVSNQISFENNRCSSITRPRFSDLNLAIEDLGNCINYCISSYSYVWTYIVRL